MGSADCSAACYECLQTNLEVGSTDTMCNDAWGHDVQGSSLSGGQGSFCE